MALHGFSARSHCRHHATHRLLEVRLVLCKLPEFDVARFATVEAGNDRLGNQGAQERHSRVSDVEEQVEERLE